MLFRILEAEGKPTLAIKKGFCWPALLTLGWIWALYKKFWPLFFVIVGAFFLIKTFVLIVLVPLVGIDTGVFVLMALNIALLLAIAKYFNFLLTAYLTNKGYKVTAVIEASHKNAALRMAK